MHLHKILLSKGYEDVTNTFDVIIIAVKTHQLDAVIPHLTHLAHEDTLIILAQNGYLLNSNIFHLKTYAKQLSI